MTDTKDSAAEKATAIAKAESDFQADMQKATDKRDAALAKYVTDSIAAQAWNEIKGKDDLPFAQCPPSLRDQLEWSAEQVIKSGVGATPFEEKVLELNASDRKKAKSA